ncbi:MAG TPA: c-type cytochrome [Humisphaera sp.]|nr:c-type cytochrome [Humisphaera sp.]
MSTSSFSLRVVLRCIGVAIVAALSASALLAKHPTNPGPENPVIKFHLPPPKPLSADEALKTFKLPPGFHIECVASEPMVEDPVFCTFGADGRIWVVEMRGYMHDLEGAGEKDPVGRIKILESTHHDGTYDKATIFLAGLVMPRAVLPLRGGALVGEPPELAFYAEKDGKAGKKTIISTAYGVKGGQAEDMANGLMPALDNWIYNAAHTFRYRFQQGKWIADVSRSRGQWGVAQDDFGRLYYCSNTDLGRVDPFPSRYFMRNPYYQATAAQNIELIPFINQDVWPSHPTPGTNRGYTETELRSDGSLTHPTAACGDSIYRGDLFPAEFRNNLFTCEPAGNLVKRMLIVEDHVHLAGKQAYLGTDFLTSTDERFRPVHSCTGPDGALYIVDMYRGVIEHRAFLTNYLIKNIEERNLLMPIHRGRIYRVVPDGATLKFPQLPKDSLALVELLGHPNGWMRDMAQRLVVEKNDGKIVAPLERMVASNPNPLARLHALWTLEGMGRLEPNVILKATADADRNVRIAAIRLCEPLLVPATRLTAMPTLLKLLDDPDPAVQLQLALTLGGVPDDAAETATARLLTSSAATPGMMRDCVISGLRGRELNFAERLLAHPAWASSSADRADTLSALARCVIAEHHGSAIKRLLHLAAAEPDGSWRQIALLRGVLRAPAKKTKALVSATQPTTKPTSMPSAVASASQPTIKPTTLPSLALKPRVRLIYLDAEPESLATLLKSPDQEVRRLTGLLDARLAWPGKPGVPAPPMIVPLTASQRQQFDEGKAIFSTLCAACHQSSGLGQDGLAPPLADSEWVLGSENRLVRIVLQGVRGQISVAGADYRLEMPALSTLPDKEIAAILTYIRRDWEHDADPVSVETVTKIREATKGRGDGWTARELLEVE